MGKNHDGHRNRLRLKIERYGFESLYSHEMLEFILFGVIQRKNTNDIAHRLIEIFDGYAPVFEQSIEKLMQVDGVGRAAALQIKSYAFHAEAIAKNKQDEKINSLGDARRFFENQFFKTQNEEFHVVLLDVDGNIIEHEIYSNDDQSKVVVPIASIMQLVYKTNPNFVVLAHNHPSGNVMPSDKDIAFTKDITSKLEDYLGIHAHEHMIFAGKKCYSFRNNGVLN